MTCPNSGHRGFVADALELQQGPDGAGDEGDAATLSRPDPSIAVIESMRPRRMVPARPRRTVRLRSGLYVA